MKWLTGGGATAAIAVGAATLWGTGWRGLLLLLAFLVSGSLLTKGGGRRTAAQVVANGGVAALAAFFGAWQVFAGAVAAATADTWATEIGAHSPTPPRMITSGRPVPRGVSGGITPLGTAGGIAGAGLIALVSWLLRRDNGGGAVFVAGVAGMLVDSILGATAQGSFKDEPAQPPRGFPWLNNDGVNLAATLAGAGVAGAGWRLCC